MADIRDTGPEERKVEEIHAAALKKARQKNPSIDHVVDRRTIKEYCYLSWEYPGAWYSRGFKLPAGFRNENKLIDAIAEETVRHFEKYKPQKVKRQGK